MAYDNLPPELEIPDGLDEALPSMISKAISHSEASFGDVQERMTDFYKGELPGITKEDKEDGRSDIVSRDVHDAVMATMPDLVRIFLGSEKLLEFKPGGPDDEQIAPQATEAVRYLFEEENDAFSIIHGSLKDGLIRKFAVATWWHEYVDRSYNEDYTLPADEFTMFIEANEGEVEVVKSKVVQKRSGPCVKATVRHIRYEHRFIVELVPPEELILSPAARTTRGDHLIGRRQNLRKERLVAMGYPEELIEELSGADNTIETGGMAAARKPEGETEPDEADEDDILYVESFVEWPHEDRIQLFKVCTAGTGHEIIACEPVDEVNMALWTPDPEPHTPVGESQAEKVEDIQRLKTGIWRGIIDSLAESLVPRMEVVEGQTNIDDAMSTEIGGLIRVRQPNMVRPVSQPFVGQQAIPLIETVDNMREERVGAFRAADGLSAEAMQSSTKMAVAATITGSKAQKELLARIYAWTFLRPIYKGLLKLFVQHQDREKWMRLRGAWTPVDPSPWNADMDCKVVNLTQAMLTVDEKAMQLGGIAEKQEQILMQMGPVNPIVSLSQYANTLREMVELTGRTNLDKYFKQVDPNWAPPPTPPQEDPAMVVARAQAASLVDKAEAAAAEQAFKTEHERQKHKDQMDLERDRLDQTRSIELLKLAAQYGIKTEQTEQQIIADLIKHRETLASQERTGAAQRDLQASNADQDRMARLADQDAARDHQAIQSDKDRAADTERHAVDTAVKDVQHQRTTQAQSDIAKQKAKATKAKPKKE